jgi:membrane-associated phospholipid phosphatase
MLTVMPDSKFLLIFLSLALFSGYVPLNRLLHKGHHFKSKFDDRIPRIDWFVYPYLPLYCAWLLVFISLMFFRSLVEVQQVFVATLICTGIAYPCFFFFPTYVVTPYPKGKGITTKLLQSLHVIDKQFNAFPSMHVFMTVLLTGFSSQWYPDHRALFSVCGAFITLSTVFTKRHYIYDIFGGIALGLLGYAGALYVV